MSFLSVSLGGRHGIIIFIFLFIKCSKKNKKLPQKKQKRRHVSSVVKKILLISRISDETGLARPLYCYAAPMNPLRIKLIEPYAFQSKDINK